jgi:hypothetical protein
LKLQKVLVAFVIGMTGFAAPSVAQKGGKGVSMDGETPLTVRSEGHGNAGSNYQGFVYGVVKALNKDAIVLTKTNAGMDQTFKLNKKTKFLHDGKSSSLASVKVGDKVWVDGAADKKTGDLIARKVVSGAFLM